MPLRPQRPSGLDFGDVCASDSLHAVEMNEGRFATDAAIGRDFKCAEIRHAMAGMNGQTLALHPTHIAGFFVKRCNVHYRFAPVENQRGYLPPKSQISSRTTQFPEGTHQ